MKKSDRYLPPGVAPYKNMHARKAVLVCGFVMTLIAFLLMLITVLFLFVPGVKMGESVSPSIMLTVFLSFAVGLAFIGVVFAVAGANTKKALARWAMFFGIVAFVLSAGMLTVITLFRTILPLEAIRRLADCVTVITTAAI